MRGNELLDKMELVDPALVAAADEMPESETGERTRRVVAGEASVSETGERTRRAVAGEASVSEASRRTRRGGADGTPVSGMRRWTKWAAVAACLCLVTAGGIAAARLGGLGIGADNPGYGGIGADNPGYGGIGANSQGENDKLTVSGDGVTIPPMKVTLKGGNVAADMVGFFIYQGRCYRQSGRGTYITLDGENAQLVGERLGTATGLIDEWTPKEGYVEFAGSVSGDFYEVKGYDPSFMLGMLWDNELGLYVCDNGITLKYGSDLLEDRLHLAGNYCALTYEDKDWIRGDADPSPLPIDVGDPAVSNLVEAINCAEFRTVEQSLKEEGVGLYDLAYRLEFVKNDGMRVIVLLYENGRVSFLDFYGVCVRIPQETCDAFLALMKQ